MTMQLDKKGILKRSKVTAFFEENAALIIVTLIFITTIN